MTNTIWNDDQVTIQGHKFTVKELPAGKLRFYLREILAVQQKASLLQDTSEMLKAVVTTVAATKTSTEDELALATARAQEANDKGFELLDSGFTHVTSLMGESTGLQPAELEGLPGSVYFQLAEEVLAKQKPMVDAFLSLAARAKSFAAGAFNGAKTTASSGAPSSSSTSSAQASH